MTNTIVEIGTYSEGPQKRPGVITIGSRIECVDCAFDRGIHRMGTVIEISAPCFYRIKWDAGTYHENGYWHEDQIHIPS